MKRYEVTEDGFVFRRGLGFGAVLFGMVPFLVAAKACLFGYLLGHLWIGALVGVVLAVGGFRLIRFFIRNKMHYLRLKRGDGIIQYGVLENLDEQPIWELSLATIRGVSVFRKNEPEQQLYTLVALVADESGGEYVLDLLPFTQEFARTIRKLLPPFHLAGIDAIEAAELGAYPFESAPFYLPDS